jgi:hypothetical protein
MAKTSTNSVSSSSLAGLSGRYTMHSERKIHEKLAAAKSGRGCDPVTALPLPTVEAAGEFGENVELF